MSHPRSAAWRRALAEGVVIILGVLIALAVDDWYAGLQEHDQEREWVAGIRDDLLQDEAALDEGLAFLDESRAAITELLGTLDDPSYVVQDTVAYLRLVKRTNLALFFRPTATTYMELMAGGGASSISNRSLMRAVIEYHQAALLTNDLNDFVREIRWYDFYDALTPTLDPTILAVLTEDWYRQVGQWPPTSPRSLPTSDLPSLARLRSDPAFRNTLGKSLDAVAVQYGDLFRMKVAANHLLEMVEAELERLSG